MTFRCTIGLLLLVAVAHAAEPGQGAFAAGQAEMWRFNSQVQSKVKELSALGALPRVNFNPRAPFPLAKPGETAVVSDAGMYFDNQSSCLLYVGNVRLNNERVRVRTAQRLYVLLPEKDKKNAAREAANPQKTAAPQAKPAAGSVPKPPNPPKQETHQDVVEITSENAAVDVPGNKALLEGRRGAPSITMERQTDSLVMQVQKNGAPAWAYANQGGMWFSSARVLWGSPLRRRIVGNLLRSKVPCFMKLPRVRSLFTARPHLSQRRAHCAAANRCASPLLRARLPSGRAKNHLLNSPICG